MADSPSIDSIILLLLLKRRYDWGGLTTVILMIEHPTNSTFNIAGKQDLDTPQQTSIPLPLCFLTLEPHGSKTLFQFIVLIIPHPPESIPIHSARFTSLTEDSIRRVDLSALPCYTALLAVTHSIKRA